MSKINSKTPEEEDSEFPGSNQNMKLPLNQSPVINPQEPKLNENPEVTDMPFVQKTDNKNNVTPVKVYGQVVSCDKDGNGFIKSQYNSILGDIFFHKHYYPIGAMVTCDVEKDNSGKFVAKKIAYKPKSGTVVSYDVEKKCGYLSGNLHFRNSDIQNNYLVSPGIKVTFDIVSDNGIECAKNIKVLNPFHGKVVEYDEEQGEGYIYIQKLKNELQVNIRDVKNYPKLIVGSFVDCYVIENEGNLYAKNVVSKRFSSYAPIYLSVVGGVIFLLLTFALKIQNWPIPYFLIINIIYIILFWYDKNIALYNAKNNNDNRKMEKPRVSEASLHFFEFLGASFVSLLITKIFHHKTNRNYQHVFKWILREQLGIFVIAGLYQLLIGRQYVFEYTFVFLFAVSIFIIFCLNFIHIFVMKQNDIPTD